MLCEYCKGNTITHIESNGQTRTQEVFLMCMDCDSKYNTKTEIWKASKKAGKISESAMRFSRLDDIDAM